MGASQGPHGECTAADALSRSIYVPSRVDCADARHSIEDSVLPDLLCSADTAFAGAALGLPSIYPDDRGDWTGDADCCAARAGKACDGDRGYSSPAWLV